MYKTSSWNELYFNDFSHKRKIHNFDPYNVFLGIATNIPVLLKTAFVLQGHIYPFWDQTFQQTFSKIYGQMCY